MSRIDDHIAKYNIDPEIIAQQRLEAEKYALRNRTQRLIMNEVSWYHALVFQKGQIRFWNDYFKLKLYLYKKYKISF